MIEIDRKVFIVIIRDVNIIVGGIRKLAIEEGVKQFRLIFRVKAELARIANTIRYTTGVGLVFHMSPEFFSNKVLK